MIVGEKTPIDIEHEGNRGTAHLLREVFDILALLNPDVRNYCGGENGKRPPAAPLSVAQG